MSASALTRRITRGLRIFFWMAFILAALLIPIYFLLGWQAARRWEGVETMLHREGETLKFTDLLPSRLPESQNYAAIPPLRRITAVEDGDENKGEPGAKRKALAELSKGLEKLGIYRSKAGLGRPSDWPAVAKELKASGLLKDVPLPGSEPEAILKRLDDTRPPAEGTGWARHDLHGRSICPIAA